MTLRAPCEVLAVGYTWTLRTVCRTVVDEAVLAVSVSDLTSQCLLCFVAHNDCLSRGVLAMLALCLVMPHCLLVSGSAS